MPHHPIALYGSCSNEVVQIIGVVDGPDGQKETVPLFTTAWRDGEGEQDAVVRATELLFADDDSAWDECQVLRRDLDNHTHGLPDF